MIHAREAPDGRLYEITHRDATYPDDVELDEMPAGFGPFRRDPTNPRRAIPHAGLVAARARDAARATAIKAEIEAMAIERLRARGVEGFK